MKSGKERPNEAAATASFEFDALREMPLRKAIYAFFDHWLVGRKVEAEASEIVVKPRLAKDLLVCNDGQVNVTFQSRHLLALALAEFDSRKNPARDRTS